MLIKIITLPVGRTLYINPKCIEVVEDAPEGAAIRIVYRDIMGPELLLAAGDAESFLAYISAQQRAAAYSEPPPKKPKVKKEVPSA